LSTDDTFLNRSNAFLRRSLKHTKSKPETSTRRRGVDQSHNKLHPQYLAIHGDENPYFYESHNGCKVLCHKRYAQCLVTILYLQPTI